MVTQFPGNGQILVVIFVFSISHAVPLYKISVAQCDGIPGGPSGGQKPKLFGYNVVFEPGASQDDVLQYSGIKRIIEMAIEGFSCTAFCYGQTGSGKTHTLTGPPDLVSIQRWSKYTQIELIKFLFFEQFIGRKPDPSDERHGLVFRAFLYLFQLLQERKDTNFILKASFLEIYNEKVNGNTLINSICLGLIKIITNFFKFI